MCKFLKVSRSNYYYEIKRIVKEDESCEDKEVIHAFYKTNIPLIKIQIFHTDRGKEYDNRIIEEILEGFEIKQSLSRLGNPYDNAVEESTYKTFRIEFCRKKFETLEQLETELFDYVNWYKTKRIHGSLGYLSPVEYRKQMSI
jgi:transposase InsO family protein